MKKKFTLALMTAIMVAAIFATVVSAGGWGGSFGMGSLWFNGWFAGLGNQDATVTLTAYGTVKALCQNNGGNIAPGRNPVTVQLTDTGVWTTDENGRADGFVETADPNLSNTPVSPNAKEDGCPADSWTVVGFDARTTNWTGAHLLVTAVDDPNHVFFDLNFTCTTSFDSNGYHTGVTCTYVP